MGNPDPTPFIITKTQRIPFKQSTMNQDIWDKKTSLRNWLSISLGWRDWLIKVAAKKRPDWILLNVDQCITLSLSDMKKNELLLKAACYFWSNSFKAFMFRQGPMTPSLADVHMLTGLSFSENINPYNLLVKPSGRLESTRSGGWSHYISNFKTVQNNVLDREHTAFLNMWLDKYLFCGQACSPTFNFLVLVEKISANSRIPLDKYLLGALYILLNKVSQCLMKN